MTNEQKNYLLELTTQLSNINGSLLELGQEIEDPPTMGKVADIAMKQIDIIQSLQNLCHG